ncbi:MAG TPA: aliphatic sulfonate ABC transporter substrate-binding protein, partial [Polyangiaceae bacterium]|nr:aliphatic sulfonate ABC transporter substrate-binding protein [Polyangiaceae bacterium]
MLTTSPKAWLSLLAVLPALLGGCHEQADESASKAAVSAAPATLGPAPKLERTVRIGYQKIGAPFLLKSRSQDLDKHLAEKGAKAEWKEFKHGPGVLEAIKAKEVDVGYVGETPPVFAQAGGVDFVYVASDPPAPKAEALIVRKDSPIKSLRDLKGKKVALNRGSNVHYLLVRALESAKLTLKDIEVVYLAPGDARPAYDSGKVDAWVIWDPFLAAAENAGSRQLANGEGLVDNRLFYVARRQFAQDEPELLRATLDEFQALSNWESKNAEEASKILAASSGVAYEALLLTEQRHAYGVLPVTDAVLDTQQKIADSFSKLELIPKEIKTRDAFLPA